MRSRSTERAHSAMRSVGSKSGSMNTVDKFVVPRGARSGRDSGGGTNSGSGAATTGAAFA
jgi:hypothetical protein